MIMTCSCSTRAGDVRDKKNDGETPNTSTGNRTLPRSDLNQHVQ